MAPKIAGFSIPFFSQKPVAPENRPPPQPEARTQGAAPANGWQNTFAGWPSSQEKLSDGGSYNAQVFNAFPKQAATGPVASLKDLKRTNVSLETVDALEGSKTLREEIQKDIDLVGREGGYANLQTAEVNGKPVHLLFTANKVTAYYDDLFPTRQVGDVGRDQSVNWHPSQVALGNQALFGAEGGFVDR